MARRHGWSEEQLSDLAKVRPVFGLTNAGLAQVAEMSFYGGLRWRRWERSTSARLVRESERVYGEIASGGEGWLDELA